MLLRRLETNLRFLSAVAQCFFFVVAFAFKLFA